MQKLLLETNQEADEPESPLTNIQLGLNLFDDGHEAEVFIKSGYYCHRTICQQASGHAGEVGVPVKIGTLVFTDGEPTYYTSSEFGKRGFCAQCGTMLIWKASDAELDWATNVNADSPGNRRDVQLTRHIYVDT